MKTVYVLYRYHYEDWDIIVASEDLERLEAYKAKLIEAFHKKCERTKLIAEELSKWRQENPPPSIPKSRFERHQLGPQVIQLPKNVKHKDLNPSLVKAHKESVRARQAWSNECDEMWRSYTENERSYKILLEGRYPKTEYWKDVEYLWDETGLVITDGIKLI